MSGTCFKRRGPAVRDLRRTLGGRRTLPQGQERGLPARPDLQRQPHTALRPARRTRPAAPTGRAGWGLYCTRAATCAEPASTPGAPCTGEEGSCDLAKGLWCNAGAKVCQVLKVAQGGEICGYLQNPPTLCTGGDFERTCRPTPPTACAWPPPVRARPAATAPWPAIAWPPPTACRASAPCPPRTPAARRRWPASPLVLLGKPVSRPDPSIPPEKLVPSPGGNLHVALGSLSPVCAFSGESREVGVVRSGGAAPSTIGESVCAPPTGNGSGHHSSSRASLGHGFFWYSGGA
jgi:hypothetical protein